MRLRDRLAGLTAPRAPEVRAFVADPQLAPAPEVARPRLHTQLAADSGIAPALRGGAMSDGGIAPALRGDAMPVLSRSERIAQLRALISDVVARDRDRERDRTLTGSGIAPALRSGAMLDGGIAPGLRGGAMLDGGIAPALRGGAMSVPAPRGPRPLPLGELRETPAGTLHVIERWLPPEHCHGRVAVVSALQVEAGLIAALALDPSLAGVDPSRMLIIDTETTGLSGGAGTVPFLIGLGLFEDGALKVEQLLLRDLGSEAPLLHHLAEHLTRASVLVTYNGKAFDWPLLRTRFVLNRIPLPPAPPHLDLLHCARRVLKARLGSVRLCEVEHALLGLRREDDIEGAEIPGRYLRYLRGEDPRTLLPVIAHNEQDVVALAAVLWRLCAHFESVRAGDDPLDHLAYARVALRGGDLARAAAFAEAAARGSDAAQLRLQAHSLSARVARRRGDPQAAALAWHAALACAGCEQSAGELHLALARLYERELRDLARAHGHARFTLPAEGPEAHGRRLGRLRRKLERMLT